MGHGVSELILDCNLGLLWLIVSQKSSPVGPRLSHGPRWPFGANRRMRLLDLQGARVEKLPKTSSYHDTYHIIIIYNYHILFRIYIYYISYIYIYHIYIYHIYHIYVYITLYICKTSRYLRFWRSSACRCERATPGAVRRWVLSAGRWCEAFRAYHWFSHWWFNVAMENG
jgi:hypothetical protein